MNSEVFDKFPELETERLILRRVTIDDTRGIFEVYSDPKVAEFEYFHPIKDYEEAGKFISRFAKEFEEKEEITWGIVRKRDNAFIGTCCFGNFKWKSERCEIGYCLNRHEWNKGYMTEVVKELVKFGLNEISLNRIEAFVTPENYASIRVLKKCNFTEEGLLRERDLMKGKLESGVALSILKRDILNTNY